MSIRATPSPNWNARKDGLAPRVLVLHYTGMRDAAVALHRLCDPRAEVSAHYVVEEDGVVHRLIEEHHRAWHAGVSAWRVNGEIIRDINSASIGIEIINKGHTVTPLLPYPQRQIEAVIALGLDIVARWNILPRYVLAHSDIAPSRKMDPGEHFPWAELADAGLGLFPRLPSPLFQKTLKKGDSGDDVQGLQQTLQQALNAFGYVLPIDGIFGAQTLDVVRAFQRHFQPQALCDDMCDEINGEGHALLQQLLVLCNENNTA
jgi:N-acetylmuramoyl-L-alanine amidase